MTKTLSLIAFLGSIVGITTAHALETEAVRCLKQEQIKKIRNVNGKVWHQCFSQKSHHLDGPSALLTPSGALLRKTHYKNGVRHGLHTEYYSNGKKKYEVMYDQDQAHGISKVFDNRGRLMTQNFYKNGKLIRTEYSEGYSRALQRTE